MDLQARSLIAVTDPGAVARAVAFKAMPGFRLRGACGKELKSPWLTVIGGRSELVACAMNGRLLKRWQLFGSARYLVPTEGLMKGICIFRIESNGRSATLLLVNMDRSR